MILNSKTASREERFHQEKNQEREVGAGSACELQLSSGQGPEECELAVGKLLCALMKEYPGIQILDTTSGKRADCYRSVRISSEVDLSFLEGTVKWICESPYRRGHKRKNWGHQIGVPSLW